jgi:hypothetical protein
VTSSPGIASTHNFFIKNTFKSDIVVLCEAKALTLLVWYKHDPSLSWFGTSRIKATKLN